VTEVPIGAGGLGGGRTLGGLNELLADAGTFLFDDFLARLVPSGKASDATLAVAPLKSIRPAVALRLGCPNA
jgi:hypothetical protein